MFDFPPWLGWLALGALFAGLLWRAMSRTDEPVRLLMKWVTTAVIAFGVWLFAVKVVGFGARGSYLGNFAAAALLAGGIATGGILIGIVWARTFGERLALPLTSLFDDGGNELKPAPLYSAVIARRKQGRPSEALAELDRQLARFPGDPEGMLLRAEILALDLKDLNAAEQTLNDWFGSGACDPGHEAVAHTKLADWHLHLAKDVEGAKRHLQSIIAVSPHTDAALFAEQRLAHLDFEAQPKNSAIRVVTDSGRPVETGVPPPVQPPAAAAEVPGLLQHLGQHPHDIAARENLVQIYAWETREADLARSQIDTLITLQNDSPRAVTRCLNLLADVEIQLAGNETGARAALQTIIDRYPDSAAAHQANNRMRFLPREMARHQHARIVGSRAHLGGAS